MPVELIAGVMYASVATLTTLLFCYLFYTRGLARGQEEERQRQARHIMMDELN